MSDKRLTGTDAKQRRGTGWGGKGSWHPSAAERVDFRDPGVKPRFYSPYRSKRGRSSVAWQVAHGAHIRRPGIAA